MRAVRHTAPGRVEVVEVSDPEPGPGEALIRMKASGICGSDLHLVRRKPLDEPYTNVRGHEPSGVIEALGPGAKGVAVGDRVTFHHYLSCGRCRRCREGNWMWCDERQGLGWHVPGAQAELMTIPARNCLKLPGELSFIDGAFISCGAATSWSALAKIDPGADDRAVVFGLGPVGLIGVAILRAMGAGVVGVGRRGSRLRLAAELGAESVIDIDEVPADGVAAALRERFPDGATLAYETSSAPAAQRQMVDVLARFGRAACVGIGNKEPAVNTSRLVSKQLTLRGSYVMNAGEYEDLARFLVEHEVDLERIVTHRFHLADAQAAYDMAADGDCAKVMFTF